MSSVAGVAVGPLGAASAMGADPGVAGMVNPATARVFTLMGDGRLAAGELADGLLATNLAVIPDRVAATPDGGFVVRADDRVLHVTPQGRVHLLATGGRRIADVAAGPDGAVYLIDEDASVILRIGADGRLAPFAGRRRPLAAEVACRADGDGGRAADAHICPMRIAMSATGLLVLDGDAATVRRIAPDGTITRIAGDGRSGQPTDGAPATASHLDVDVDEDSDIAPTPDGSPVILTGSGIWTVGLDGRLHRLLRIGRFGDWYRTVMPLSDGAVLTGGYRVGLLTTGGLHALTTDPACCGLWSAFDGDAGPLSSDHWMQPLDFALDADGGWLIADIGHLRYVPPTAPRRLAVGIARPTVSSRLPVTATIETTRPSRISVTVRIHGRRVGATTVERAPGRWRIPVPGGRAGALNVVSVSAASADQPPQVATDRVGVVPGDTLPIAVARNLANADAESTREIGGGNPTMTCRRIDRRRVDCAEFDLGLCQQITAYRLRPDGILTGRDYGEATQRCRFKTHPRWPKGPYGVELPSD